MALTLFIFYIPNVYDSILISIFHVSTISPSKCWFFYLYCVPIEFIDSRKNSSHIPRIRRNHRPTPATKMNFGPVRESDLPQRVAISIELVGFFQNFDSRVDAFSRTLRGPENIDQTNSCAMKEFIAMVILV